MTVPSLTAELAASDSDTAARTLRSRGMRLSAARRLVLEALYLADGPVTAEEIATGVGGRVPPSDLASVYRNLDRLERLGMVRHMHLGHGPGLYAPAGQEREYILCEGCSSCLAVGSGHLEGVRATVRAAVGFEARFSHFPLVGLCPTCAAVHRDGV
jgi:Fur family transcriptional regulator, ferric uptake regulator